MAVDDTCGEIPKDDDEIDEICSFGELVISSGGSTKTSGIEPFRLGGSDGCLSFLLKLSSDLMEAARLLRPRVKVRLREDRPPRFPDSPSRLSFSSEESAAVGAVSHVSHE